MSNPGRAIGKVFKKVVKFVKKIALPVIAVAAVVLTGGAALGVLPSLGAMAGSIGLSATSGLGAVLISAAKAATFGAVTSAVMGKNPIKGATMGFLTGGLLGAAGALPAGTGPMSALGFGKSAAEQVAAAGGNFASAAGAPAASGSLGMDSLVAKGVGAGAQAGAGAASAAPVASGAAIGSTAPAVSSLGLDSLAAASGAPAATAAAPASAAATAAQAAGATTAAQTASAAGAGGGGFLSNMNPMTAGMLIQGAGTGFSALAASKDAAKERKQYGKNYEGIANSVFRLPTNNAGPALPDAGESFRSRMFGRMVWDPRLGEYVEEGA